MSNRQTDHRFGEFASVQEAVFSREGQSILGQFYVMLKTAKLYDPDNNNFRRQLSQTEAVLASCFEQFGEMSLQIRAGYFFFCDVRVRDQAGDLLASSYLHEVFEEMEISGFVITAPPSADEIASLFSLLAELSESGVDDFAVVTGRFAEAGIKSVEPLPAYEEDIPPEDDEKQRRQEARRSYSFLVSNAKAVAERIRADKQVNFLKTHRIIHNVVDQVLSDDSYLLELTALKSHDEYTYLHSTNVCIYAVSVGAHLGLSKLELASLGFAALFHDYGKTRLPADLLNKPGSLTESERLMMRNHPVKGAIAIASTMTLDDKSAHAMLAAFEHHLNLDGTGYPERNQGRIPTLFSRIVAICDVFDAMTSGRVYREEPIAPEESLQLLLRQSGVKFDPLLFKVFANVVSAYPAGTLLLLDTGELAMATSRNARDLFRPRAILVGNAEGLFDNGVRVNLADRDPVTGEYRRTIVRSVAPSRLSVDLSRFVMETD